MANHTHKKADTSAALDCPECCCILEICCNSPEAALEAYVAKAVKDTGCTPDEAKMHAEWTLKHFALAPKSFKQVVADIVTMARQ